jgi:Flp pilus assembly pilin Flp
VNLFILKTWLQGRLSGEQRGASMVEYAFLLALIAVIAIAAVRTFGDNVSTQWSDVTSRVS